MLPNPCVDYFLDVCAEHWAPLVLVLAYPRARLRRSCIDIGCVPLRLFVPFHVPFLLGVSLRGWPHDGLPSEWLVSMCVFSGRRTSQAFVALCLKADEAVIKQAFLVIVYGRPKCLERGLHVMTDYCLGL